MADSDFWLALAISFRELHHGSVERLAAEWAPVGKPRDNIFVWRLRGQGSDETRFAELAKVAAGRLAPKERDKLAGWLNRVKTQNPHVSHPKSRRIDDIAKVSGDFCERLYLQHVLANKIPLQPRPPKTATSVAKPIPNPARIEPQSQSETPWTIDVVEIDRRRKLFSEYKSATDEPSNLSIYTAKNSGVHKPEFYAYLNGELPATSEIFKNFERFLREKKKPLPRQPKTKD